MSALLDSSVLVAALANDELRHAECLALLLKGGNRIYSHALLETFSTLTGGKLSVRVTADLETRQDPPGGESASARRKLFRLRLWLRRRRRSGLPPRPQSGLLGPGACGGPAEDRSRRGQPGLRAQRHRKSGRTGRGVGRRLAAHRAAARRFHPDPPSTTCPSACNATCAASSATTAGPGKRPGT